MFFKLKKIRMKNSKSSYILCGVEAGYQGVASVTPKAAAKAVESALRRQGVSPRVYPAVCIYHTDWGCPVGGEPVGAFCLHLPAEGALEVCESLRKELRQTTLSVCLPTEGAPTIGFTAVVKGNLCEVGSRWQALAAELMSKTGTYISGGLVDNGDGSCTMSAEANPAFVPDREAWQRVVEELTSNLGTKPDFGETFFNYLKGE